MEAGMVRRRIKVNKEPSTAIRLSIPSELWRKFRAGCLYMDKDVNSELNRLLENWVKEWHKHILKPEPLQGEQNVEHPNVETRPFSAYGGHSNTGGEGGGSV
jgi:hypothetical protein